MTVLLWAVAGYVTASRVRQALLDRRLILEGLPVKARIISANNATTPKRWPRNQPMPATIRFSLPDGRQVELAVRLDAKPHAYAMVGEDLQIRVDPSNPRRWTEQTEPSPWSKELIAPALLIPVAVVLTVLTVIRRRSVLKTWQQAPEAVGVVVETRHAAIAPRSRLVRFTLQDGLDRRVWSVLWPASRDVPHPGQSIELICPPNRPSRCIAARLYVE